MIRNKKFILFDWGNTIMRDFTDETGVMYKWNKVESMPNAEKILVELSGFADCFIATNAKDSEKSDIVKALQRVELHRYFIDIFCFKELGVAKPAFAYFNAIANCLQASKNEMVMIGDDLIADVEGATNFGIDAVLYDFDNKYQNYNGFKINNLLQLLEL